MNTANFDVYDSQSFSKFCVPAQIERDLQQLSGLITGIACDKVINEAEKSGLVNWLFKVATYRKAEPYNSISKALESALEDDFLTAEEIQDIVWLCNEFIEKTNYYDLITKGVQKLSGIVEGILIDDKINEKEITFLQSWMDENDYLKNCWPYDELYSFSMSITKDNTITKEEQYQLIAFCKSFTASSTGDSNSSLVETIAAGYCQVDPDIILQEKSFCITGNSQKYKRKEIAEKIELFGGFVTDKVSKNIHYLVVCDEKNNCWAYTCYGRKIEQAIKLRKSGHQIVIVHEFDLYDALLSMK